MMTTRPANLTTTKIHHAAKIMMTRHLRHLPVAGDAGLLGVVDITDVCRVISRAQQACGENAGPRLTGTGVRLKVTSCGMDFLS